MYETLLRLYQESKLKETGLNNAVTKGWITEEQKAEIIASINATQQGNRAQKKEVIILEERPKTYLCDPTKNKKCKKSHCYIINGECSETLDKEYKVSFAKKILLKILGI